MKLNRCFRIWMTSGGMCPGWVSVRYLDLLIWGETGSETRTNPDFVLRMLTQLALVLQEADSLQPTGHLKEHGPDSSLDLRNLLRWDGWTPMTPKQLCRGKDLIIKVYFFNVLVINLFQIFTIVFDVFHLQHQNKNFLCFTTFTSTLLWYVSLVLSY